MATLLLTTIGGAIGGPIGAMLGGIVGQSVDREILFKPKGREGPRLTELAVQTSSYGTPIPQIFGTLRVAGSVIWATDLVEHRSSEGGGKGRPGVTRYSYTASFAVALSARPILSVGRIWADGKLLRGAAGDWKARTGFRLHSGGEDQAIDPLIAAAEGGGLTPAHRGIAYAVFEDLELADYGNRIPSLTFEVVADAAAVSAGGIVAAVTQGAVGAGEAATAIGGFSAYGASRRAVIEPLVQAAGGWPVSNGAALTLAQGSGAAAVLADAGVEGGTGDRAVAAADRTPRRVMLRHYDPARDYQAGLQRAARPGAGAREEAIKLPAALDAGMAKQLAEAALARADVERERRTLACGWAALAVVPGGRVEIAGEPGQWRVIGWRLEKMAVRLELVRIAPAALPVPASSGRVLGAPDDIAGATILHAFELPHLGDGLLAAPRVSVAACGEGPGWRRAVLAISTDAGSSWTAVGLTAAPAVIGTVEMPAGWADPLIEDRRSALTVELVHDAMVLADADDAALDAGANLALVGQELLQFGHAEPLGGNRWRLTRLWRGRRGTEAAVGTGSAGDRFVRIVAEGLAQRDLPAGSAGPIGVMATGTQDADGVMSEVPLTGVSVVPPAPVALRWTATGDGGATLHWTRRSREGWRWIDGNDAPLGEESERYQLRLAGGDMLGEATEPVFAIPAEARAGGPIEIEVRHAGDHGLSPAATITIPPIEE
jgi:hypothetical protein